MNDAADCLITLAQYRALNSRFRAVPIIFQSYYPVSMILEYLAVVEQQLRGERTRETEISV